ncbi:MAG TPA: hypothetical protein VFG76_00595 [Candidatus Polarisedimenticolia bacterium]|nr:hypothetical protein [Candidatus Polarisedimenticolia bacterium]
MLRITQVVESTGRITLSMEGNLDAEFVSLLEHQCASLLVGRKKIRIELRAVLFVDRAGIEALARLGRSGVEICCRPGVVASVLESEGIGVTLVSSNAW